MICDPNASDADDTDASGAGTGAVSAETTVSRAPWLSVKDTTTRNVDPPCAEVGTKEGPVSPAMSVVPACHYTCGGVQVDTHSHATVEGLYAVGEVSCTGLHGANRLASNSLLEAVVFAHRAVEHAVAELLAASQKSEPALPRELPPWDVGNAAPLEEQIDIAACWLEIRTLMWNYVGIVRSDRRLERARRRLELLKAEINEAYWKYLLTRDLIELRNLVTVADLIVQCALQRKESRGLHFTVDYPALAADARDSHVG